MQLWELKLLVQHTLVSEPSLLVALGLLVALAVVSRKWLVLKRRHLALRRSYEGLLKEMEDTGVRRELALLKSNIHPLSVGAQSQASVG